MASLLAILTLISVIGASLSFSCDTCRHLPREKTAVCNLKASEGALYFPNCSYGTDSPGRVWLGPGEACALLAGMDVQFEDCPSVYRGSVAAGKELVGGSLQSVRGEDAGEYVCVGSDGVTVLGQRNITVSDSPAITASNIQCDLGYSCHVSTQSCGWRDGIIRWNFVETMKGYVRELFVYGLHPINASVTVEWDNPLRQLTLDDLAIQILHEVEDPLVHEFVIFSNGSGHWPETLVDYRNGTQYIDHDVATATVIIEAQNSVGSSRLQFKTQFQDLLDQSKYYGLDRSLPDNQTVSLGDSAQFSCQFSTSTNPTRSRGFHVFVRWRMPSGLEEGCNCGVDPFSSDKFVCYCETSRIRITYDSLDSSSVDRLVLTVRGSVDSVSVNDTGSVFSCALATSGEKFDGDYHGPYMYPQDLVTQDLVIQWRKEATLTVSPPLTSPTPTSPTPTSPTPSSSSAASIGLYVGVPLVLVLVAGAAIATVLLLWLVRRRKNINIEIPMEETCLPPENIVVTIPLIKNRSPPPSGSEQSLDSVSEDGSLQSSTSH